MAVALASPSMAFSVRRRRMARCLEKVRSRSPSRRVTASSSSARRSAGRLRGPLGRPEGLPERPGAKRVRRGGLA